MGLRTIGLPGFASIFIFLASCSSGSVETRSISNIITSRVEDAKYTVEAGSNWLDHNILVIGCKSVVNSSGYPEINVILKSRSAQGVELEWKATAIKENDVIAVEGSSKDWKKEFISPNEEIPIVFISSDKDVKLFKLNYRVADPVQ